MQKWISRKIVTDSSKVFSLLALVLLVLICPGYVSARSTSIDRPASSRLLNSAQDDPQEIASTIGSDELSQENSFGVSSPEDAWLSWLDQETALLPPDETELTYNDEQQGTTEFEPSQLIAHECGCPPDELKHRDAYLLGGRPQEHIAQVQINELASRYRHVTVNDSAPNNTISQILFELISELGYGNITLRLGEPASNLRSLNNVDIYVVAPNSPWLTGTLASDLKKVIGANSVAYVATEHPTDKFLQQAHQQGLTIIPHPDKRPPQVVLPLQVSRPVKLNSFYFQPPSTPIHLIEVRQGV